MEISLVHIYRSLFILLTGRAFFTDFQPESWFLTLVEEIIVVIINLVSEV